MSCSGALRLAVVTSCLTALLAAACGNSDGSNVNGSGNASAQAGTVGTAGTMGGPDLGSLGGVDSGSNGTGGGDIGDECAGDLIEAQRVPLDMYVMLDVSGSMLSPTEGDMNVTKWQAVSSALSGFISDDASAGIGVGLQVFPIRRAEAPTSCTSDQACGNFGPCANRGCWPLQGGILNGCLDRDNCGVFQDCVVVGECANDADYVCNAETTTNCGAGRGACTVPESVCFTAGDCRPATYATAAADIAELPAAAPGLLSVINSAMPDPEGLTPTGPALGGAIQQAGAWASAHPDHQVVAVLATDGMPTLEAKGMLCTPVRTVEQVQAVPAIAAAGLAGDPSITTFVIGVVGPEDLGAPATLNAIATSGGSGDAFIVDTTGDVAMQFRDALNQIRASGLSCDLLVPTAEAGKTVDYGKVNVVFDDGSGSSTPTLGYVGSAANCAKEKEGWYFDRDPDQGETPERILVCPDTCAKFREVDMGSVQIKLGCLRRDVVK
jgi:hypothetical protein